MIELFFPRIFLAIRRRSVEISKIVEATGNGNGKQNGNDKQNGSDKQNGNGKQLYPILIDIIHYNTLLI
jgi:hypothetical protein